MKLTITTNVSVDGVMQGLGGSDEDRRGGFERGGWAIPLLDTEAGDHINEVYGGAAAFLFGRRTYEIFAGSWGAIEEMRAQPIGGAFNKTPKSGAPTTLPPPPGAAPTNPPPPIEARDMGAPVSRGMTAFSRPGRPGLRITGRDTVAVGSLTTGVPESS